MREFSKQHPAFLYAIAAVMGCFFAIHPHSSLFFPAIMIIVLLLNNRQIFRLLLAIMVFFTFWFYVSSGHQIPILNQDFFGEANLSLHTVRQQKTRFGKVWKYCGTLLNFRDPETDQFIARNLPITITIPCKKEFSCPKVDHTYRIRGRLGETKGGTYFFSIAKGELWKELVASKWSFGEWRYRVKQHVGKYIQSNYQDPNTVDFLKGIATGEVDSPRLVQSFARFGLQHILAISGFHFALVAGTLHFMLRIVLPRKWTVLFLIFLLSSYFLFLGCSSSILRAWLTITIALTAQILRRQSNGLNALGAAVLCILIYDPFMCRQLGFQFSVLTTAAILLFFPPIDLLLGMTFKKRPLSELLTMPRLDQHLYIALGFIRQGAALCLAVNSVALPIMLLTFGKFPYLSLVYNLFFPFLVSFTMLLFILGSFADLIFPGLGTLFHWVNQFYTRAVLGFAYHMPTTIDFTLRVPDFPSTYVVAYLCILFVIGVALKEWVQQKQESWEDLVFI